MNVSQVFGWADIISEKKGSVVDQIEHIFESCIVYHFKCLKNIFLRATFGCKWHGAFVYMVMCRWYEHVQKTNKKNKHIGVTHIGVKQGFTENSTHANRFTHQNCFGGVRISGFQTHPVRSAWATVPRNGLFVWLGTAFCQGPWRCHRWAGPTPRQTWVYTPSPPSYCRAITQHCQWSFP